MKIEEAAVETFSFGQKEVSVARIQASAKAFEILSSSLYSNSVLAIIRELSANAKDSHTAAGKPDTPFDIQLPNKLDPQFKVRDYGVGMSHEFVMTRVNTYFDSTKNDSDNEIGGFGLGMKSVFSYATSFMIICFDGTTRRVYAYQIGSSGMPEISFLAENPSNDPVGVELAVPVMDVDYDKFKENAIEALSFYFPRPNIIGAEEVSFEPKVMFEGTGWTIYQNTGHFNHARYVEMGNVIYPILENQMYDHQPGGFAINNTRHHRIGREDTILVFKAGIGQIDITPNREQIKLTDRTKEQIKVFTETVKNELAAKVQAELDTETATYWKVVKSDRVQSIRNNSHFYGRFGIDVKVFTYKGLPVINNEVRYVAEKKTMINANGVKTPVIPKNHAGLIKKCMSVAPGYSDGLQRRDVMMDYYGIQITSEQVDKTKIVVGPTGFIKKLTMLRLKHLQAANKFKVMYLVEVEPKNVQTVVDDIKLHIVDFTDITTWEVVHKEVKDVTIPDIYYVFDLDDVRQYYNGMPKHVFDITVFKSGTTIYYEPYTEKDDSYGGTSMKCALSDILTRCTDEQRKKLIGLMNKAKIAYGLLDDQVNRLNAAGVTTIKVSSLIDKLLMEVALEFAEFKPTMSLPDFMAPMIAINKDIVASTHYKALKYWARMSGDTDFYELLLRLNDESTSSYRPSEADYLFKALGKTSIKDYIAKHKLTPKKKTSNQIVKDLVKKAPLISMLVTRYNNPLVVQYVEQMMGWDKKNLTKKPTAAKKA